MEKLIAYIIGNKIEIQPGEYIDDGWYVVINNDKIQLYEISTGGVDPIYIGEYKTLIEAIIKGKSLT